MKVNYWVISGQFPEWCIADEQTPDEELQRALDWTCGMGGADCTKIQKDQPCYLPNTVKDHASFAFNNYYQKLKHKGASCYFNAAAITTDLDPSKISIYSIRKMLVPLIVHSLGLTFTQLATKSLVGSTRLREQK